MNTRFLFAILVVSLGLLFNAHTVAAQSASKDTFPRYASLKRAVTNVRAGPGTQYPILWVFKRKNWPVQIMARYQTWYKVRDMEGEEGWVYASLVSGRRTVVVDSNADPITMFRRADAERPVLRFEDGNVLGLEKCSPYMCKVKYRNYKGWVLKDTLAMVE